MKNIYTMVLLDGNGFIVITLLKTACLFYWKDFHVTVYLLFNTTVSLISLFRMALS